MDDVADPGLHRPVHQRLALVEHGDGVAGQEEQAVHPGEGRPERLRVVQVEQDRLLASGPQLLDIGLLAGGEPHLHPAGVTAELVHDQPPRLAGGPDDEGGRLLGSHVVAP